MKKYLLIGLALLTTVVLAGCKNSEAPINADEIVASPIAIQESFLDRGTIAMDQGDISMDFKLTNNGEEAVVVKRMYTSCLCTSAALISDNKTSNTVGMPGHGISDKIMQRIQPGETATVEVTFNPNAHGPNGTGVNRRAIYLETNSGITPELELGFTTTVVRTSAELPDQPLFAFEETEFDFGLIKQSGGIVTREFPFTYNGENSITITGVPTSCACTTASIDKQELTKGDKATITVEFDPNLHDEPEGRFFKTITLLTDPTLEEEPELKIWVEIDLDLGPEAFKLQGEHTD